MPALKPPSPERWAAQYVQFAMQIGSRIGFLIQSRWSLCKCVQKYRYSKEKGIFMWKRYHSHAVITNLSNLQVILCCNLLLIPLLPEGLFPCRRLYYLLSETTPCHHLQWSSSAFSPSLACRQVLALLLLHQRRISYKSHASQQGGLRVLRTSD